jgi:hypothetical protein
MIGNVIVQKNNKEQRKQVLFKAIKAIMVFLIGFRMKVWLMQKFKQI